MTQTALTIGGSDPTGLTGVSADLAVFSAHRVASACVVTATNGPSMVYPMPTTVVGGQLSVALRHGTPAAVKVGILGTAEIASTVAAHVRSGDLRHVVVDPELDSGHGSHRGIVGSLIRLLPLVDVITPNLDEAGALVGWPVTSMADMAGAAAQLAALGGKYVVVTGGRLGGNECIDAIWTPSGTRFLRGPRVDAPTTRGAGCMFSAAITARLAQGRPVAEAVKLAKQYVAEALAAASTQSREAVRPTKVTASVRPMPAQRHSGEVQAVDGAAIDARFARGTRVRELEPRTRSENAAASDNG